MGGCRRAAAFLRFLLDDIKAAVAKAHKYKGCRTAALPAAAIQQKWAVWGGKAAYLGRQRVKRYVGGTRQMAGSKFCRGANINKEGTGGLLLCGLRRRYKMVGGHRQKPPQIIYKILYEKNA